MLRRLRRTLLAAVALLLLGAASAAAEGNATITFDVSKNVNVEGTQSDGHGWIRTTVKGHKPLEFVVVKLKPGKDSGFFANTAYRLTLRQLSRWGTLVLGGTTRPGAPYVATTSLTPGWHSILVRGRDGYVPGGFTVGSTASDEPRPETGATVRLTDGAIDAPATLPAGTTIDVVNGGGQIRDLRIARLSRIGVGLANEYLSTRRERLVRYAQSPLTLTGWVSPRVSTIVTPRLAPGRWALISRGADGRGLVRSVRVK